MKKIFTLFVAMVSCTAFLWAQDAKSGQFLVSSMFSDHMVLQRETSAPVWGFAPAGAKVSVSPSWEKKKYSCVAGDDGRWKVAIQTPGAGGPYTLTVSCGKEKFDFVDVMSGEVWFCSGQSNMAMRLKGESAQKVEGGVDAILEASEYSDRIRLYNIQNEREFAPVENIDCHWTLSDSKSAGDFSAIGYFFAKQLTISLGVPVGMICGAWGGCNLETWIPMEYIDKAIKGKVPEEKYRMVTERKEDFKLPPLQVGTLYNARLNPVKGYAIKGFLWYQATSNMYEYSYYDLLQEQLAQCWRDSWGDADNSLPFYFCTIAPFAYTNASDPVRGYFVEKQLHTLDLIPNSGAAVTETLGDSSCIHPAKKPQVARQLSLLALERDYGFQTGLGCGFPYPKSVTFPSYSTVEPKKINQSGFEVRLAKSDNDHPVIVIQIANAASGVGGYYDQLADKYVPVHGFEVAGPDKVFHSVPATAGHKTITLDCSGIENPVAVRYAFHCFCETDVVTCWGTPMPSFRTDEW